MRDRAAMDAAFAQVAHPCAMPIGRVTAERIHSDLPSLRGGPALFPATLRATPFRVQEDDLAHLTPSSSAIGKIRATPRFPSCMERRNIHFALARHYGRKCRLLFPNGDWRQHEAHIASGWAYMGRELPWDEARDTVLEGWRTVDFDGREALFSAINDDAAERGRARALQ